MLNSDKKPKYYTCKVCKSKYIKTSSFHVACSIPCSIKYVKKQAERENKEKLKKDRERLKTKAKWMSEAQSAFNRFIRLRDHNDPCISCGWTGKALYQAGHYVSVGASGALRFNENNVHKQCSQCNHNKSGNIVRYRVNLIKKIGQEAVDELDNNHELKRYTIEELRFIKEKYNELSDSLRKSLLK